jgi:hypothetical protein
LLVREDDEDDVCRDGDLAPVALVRELSPRVDDAPCIPSLASAPAPVEPRSPVASPEPFAPSSTDPSLTGCVLGPR